jgi:hypothetical protein
VLLDHVAIYGSTFYPSSGDVVYTENPELTEAGYLQTAGSYVVGLASNSTFLQDINGEPRPSYGAALGADEFVDNDNGDGTGDGLPDWWEMKYFSDLDETGAGDSDLDTLDGLSNVLEYQYGTSPLLFDTDGDGTSDFEPTDSDGDGMGDFEELEFGLNPLLDDALDDADADGYPNIFEVRNGTDPGDQMSVPVSTFSLLAGTDLQEIIDGILEDTYAIIALESGNYTNFTITGKHIMLIGQDPLSPPVIEGGRVTVSEATVVIDSIIFDGESAGTYSDALYLSGSRVLLNSLEIRDHDGSNSRDGVIVISDSSVVKVTNSIFIDNTDFDRSAGLYIYTYSGEPNHVTVDHCTFLNCVSNNSSYGMNVASYAISDTVIIRNSIFWSNSEPDLPLIGDHLQTATIENTIIRGGFISDTDNVLVLDPKLNAFGCLTVDSIAAIDQASISNLTTDIHGELRPTGVASDIGADEFVDNDNGDGTGDGLPDWWEMKYFSDLDETSAGDSEEDQLDGLSNALEYQYGSSPLLFDTDGDGMSDLQLIDSDGDGMGDSYELQYGLNPELDDALDDADADGYPNIFEVKNGSAPGDQLSIPVASISLVEGDSMTTAIETLDGDGYYIIELSPGEYQGGFDVVGKRLLLISQDLQNPAVILNGASRASSYSVSYYRLGIGVQDGSTVVFSHVVFDGENDESNRTPLIISDSRLLLQRVTLKDFLGISYVLDSNESNVCIDNTIFSDNAASRVLDSYESIVCIDNTIFLNNETSSSCIYVSGSGFEFKINHSTFLNCISDESSLGVIQSSGLNDSNSFEISNSILWTDDLPNDSLLGSDLELALIENTIVRGGFIYDTVNVFDLDPKLNIFGCLTADSIAAIDQASISNLTTDIHGELRPTGVASDIGADEFVDNDNGDGTGDGLPDWWEMKYFSDLDETSAGDSEEDQLDGLSNALEYLHGTSPLLFDTDANGISDFDQIDSDGDGMGDSYELQYGLNPELDDALDDTDADGYPNIFEVCNGADPRDRLSIPVASIALVEGDSMSTAIESLDGDSYYIIELSPGEYQGGFDVVGKRVLFISQDLQNPAVILNGLGRYSYSTRSGIEVEEGSIVVFSNVVFDGENDERNSGPLTVEDSRLLLQSVVIKDFFDTSSVLRTSSQSTVRIDNTIFLDNETSSSCIYVSGSGSEIKINHSTFLNCISDEYSLSTIHSYEPSGANYFEIRNSIFWMDDMPEDSLLGNGLESALIENTIVRGGFIYDTVNVSDLDPKLNVFGYLTADSVAAIDQVSISNLTTDIHGELRPTGVAADIGADEFVDNDNGDGTGDGLPDWWEMKYFSDLDETGAGDSDMDTLDGLSNALEYKYGTSPLLFDTNADGVSDLEQIDSDGDGMGDVEELLWGFDPSREDAFDDFDGDRYPNVYEVKNGSDPFSFEDTPTPHWILDLNGGGDFTSIAEACDFINEIQEEDAEHVDFGILKVMPGEYILYDDDAFYTQNNRLMIVSSDGPGSTVIDHFSDDSSAFDLRVGGTVVDGFTVISRGDYCSHVDASADATDRYNTILVQNCRFTGRVSNSVVNSVERNDYDKGELILRNIIFNGIRFQDYSLIDTAVDNTRISFEHCTFSENEYAYLEAGWSEYMCHYSLTFYDECEISFINCILADEIREYADPFYGYWDDVPAFDHTIMLGVDVDDYADQEILTLDPDLTDQGLLQYTSLAAIDQGKRLNTDPLSRGQDIHLENRAFNDLPDIGADEFVDVDADGWADFWIYRYYTGVVGLLSTANDDDDSLDAAAEYFWGTNPFEADSDGDGLNDSYEVLTTGTSPTNRDTDGDWLLDGGDPAPLEEGGFLASDTLEVWHSASDLNASSDAPFDRWFNRSGDDSYAFEDREPYVTISEDLGGPLVQFGKDPDSGAISPSALQLNSAIDGRLESAGGVELFVVLKAPQDEDISALGTEYDGLGGLWSFADGQTRYPNNAGWIEDYVGSSSMVTFDPKIDIERLHLYHVSVSDEAWTGWINDYEIFTRSSNDFVLPDESIILGLSNDQRYLFTGQIAEILVFAGTLSEVERTEVTDYLLWQYDISKVGQPVIEDLTLGGELLGDGAILLGSDVLAVNLEVPDYVEKVEFYVSSDGLSIDEEQDLYATDFDGSDGFSTYVNLVDKAENVVEFKAKAYNVFSEATDKLLTSLTVRPTTLKDSLYVEWLAASDEETPASQLWYRLEYRLGSGENWHDLFPLVDVNGKDLPLAAVGGGLLEFDGNVISYIWDVSTHADHDDVYVRVSSYDGESYSEESDIKGPYDLDNGAPTGGAIHIVDGDYTADMTVTLNLSAIGATGMWIREDGDFSDPETANWLSYVNSLDFTFSTASLGEKSVYVKYRDQFGNITDDVFVDTILLREPWDITYNSESPILVMDSESVSEGDSVLIDGVEVLMTGALKIAELTLVNGATLTTPETTNTQAYRLELDVLGAVTIDSTSSIDVSGRGYLGGYRGGNTYAGRTLGNIAGSYRIAGGSYGGLGSLASYDTADSYVSDVYGDYRNPDELGSGGGSLDSNRFGGDGGGLIRLSAQSLVLDGSILANGVSGTQNGGEYCGAGSGGGIYLDVISLSGSGEIRADGGSGPSTEVGAAAGGGGRVAIYYDGSSSSFDFNHVTAFGGLGYQGVSGTAIGGAGTVYLENTTLTTGDLSGVGELIIDNDGVVGQYATPLRSVGSGTSDAIGGISGSVLSDSSADFSIGYDDLHGLWLQPNTSIDTYFRIIDNSATTITVEGDLSTIAVSNDSYQGVVNLKALTLRGNAIVESEDPLVPTATLTEENGVGTQWNPAP